MQIDADALRRAKAVAKEMFRQLKARYPNLWAALHFSSRHGQADIDLDLGTLLKVFPKMFVDTEAKTIALSLMKERSQLDRQMNEARKLKKSPADIEAAIRECEEELKRQFEQLVVADDVEVTLIFDQLDYNLIKQLQRDPLIDQTRTPQTRASIKVSLGSVADLAKRQMD